MTHVLSLSTLFPNAVNTRFGIFVARSMEALAKRDGWKVSLINPIGLPPVHVGRYRALARLEEYSEEFGLSIYRPRFSLIPKMSSKRNAHAIAKAALPLVQRIHQETPIDLIDAQFFFPDGPAAAWIAKEMGLPLSIKARGSDINRWGHEDFAREQMLEAAERADGLLAVSQSLANEMVALGMSPRKIRVHYTGLDRDRFRPLHHTGLRARVGQELGFEMPESVPLMVSVGALIPRKGQDLAIAALAGLPTARLILVGRGDDEKHLRDLSSDLEVAERVHFAGAVNHDLLPVILSCADAMVLPSQAEGLSNAWIEALACGTRIITSDVGGAREVITTEMAGRLVRRTPEAIVGAMHSLMVNKVDRSEVAETVAHFNWSTHASQLANHYNLILGKAD